MNADVLSAAYEAFAAVVRPLGDEESWRPTGCTGWAVCDLVFHCAGGRPAGPGRRIPSARRTAGAGTG
ncbi:maleylpyruvate isomerase N-terminal domain-containing protein [Streptomyces sviceus]|uniref:maleylpyruvate isomerase N-terminal domain-containing protein n=1 Tax=Streptomyces sviceus TaxID=285530 RepID=UPI003699A768